CFPVWFGRIGFGRPGPGGLGLGWLIGFVGFYGFGLAGFGLDLFLIALGLLVALARALGRARALARRRRSAERFQIGGDDGRRFAAGRVMLTQEAGQAERAADLRRAWALLWQRAQFEANSCAPDLPESRFSCAPAEAAARLPTTPKMRTKRRQNPDI